MPSPFPGIDPYLETPLLWPDVHHEILGQIRAALNPSLRPEYVARVELRVYISDEDDLGREALMPDVREETVGNTKRTRRPKAASALAVAEPLVVPVLLDEEIKEARLEIRHRSTNSLVTVIEVLGTTNKIRGSRGRVSFMEKKEEILASKVNWVEIDLLRGGTPSVTRPPLVASDYRVLISRADDRHHARYWPISVRQALPVVGIPLRGDDADVPLDLGAALRDAYANANYDLSIDYRKPAEPPLGREDVVWAERLLHERGLRK